MDTLTPPTWVAEAKCATGHDPDLWFPEVYHLRLGVTPEAVRICRGCTVRAECLRAGLANDARHGIRWGVWGGLSPVQRARLVAKASA